MLRSMFRTFGVALMAALSLMAMLAVGAQGAFSVLGLTTLVAGTTISGTGLHGVLLIKAKNAYILCEAAKVVEAKGLNASELLAIVRFEKCVARNHTTNALLAACPIEGENALGEKGTVDSAWIGRATLHAGKLYVVFQGHASGAAEEFIGTFKFGPECGIGVKVNKSGLIAAEVDNGESKAEHLLTFSEAIQKLLGVKLSYGTTEVFVNGIAHIKLSGAHATCTWAVI